MSLPKNSAASGMVYGIVVGGDSTDPAPDMSNNLRVYFPGIHGKDVNVKHLAFSPRLMSPDRMTQGTFPGGLDPGSLVVALKDTGSNQCQIMGLANDINNNDTRLPGNIDLLQPIQEFFTKTVGVNIPPNIQDSTRDGAKIRKITEKGQEHHHNLLKGLPTHGALFPILGTVIPEMKNVATAIQSFSDVLTSDLLSQLPGVQMSLGQMFSELQSTSDFKSILKLFPRELGNAFQNMSTLIQAVETSEGSGFSTNNRVDSSTFMENAISLFNQCTNLSDICTSMQMLQTDTSLHGLDKLKDVAFKVLTPFGEITKTLSANGEISNGTDDATKAIQKLAEAFSAGAKAFPGVNPGENLFTSGAGTIFSMAERLAPEVQSVVKQMADKLNSSDVAKKLDAITKELTKSGGNPLKLLVPKG